jgi:hypothetical protein
MVVEHFWRDDLSAERSNVLCVALRVILNVDMRLLGIERA